MKVLDHKFVIQTSSINVRRPCKGIVFWQDTLIVTYAEGGMGVFNLTGGLVREVFCNGDKQLFYRPSYVAVSDIGPALFVTDQDKHTVNKMGIDQLNVEKTFKHKSIVGPRYVVPVDTCHVLVCGEESNNLALLNTETHDVRVLLGPDQGIQKPICVAYSAESEKLYIACKGDGKACNPVKVFGVVPRS